MRLHIPPSLRSRPFRLLWLGLMISIAGAQMQFWALLWNIRLLAGEEFAPIALGGIGLARLIPLGVFSLIGGVTADRRNRRAVMAVSQTSMALVALTLAALSFQGQLALWQIYGLTALQAVAGAFDLPARQSLTPNLVPQIHLSNAFSLTSIAYQVGSIAGPAMSGIVIANLGLQYTYLINAATFLAVLLALALMGQVPQDRYDRSPGSSGIEAVREGFRFLKGRPIILSSMVLDFFATFFSSANALLPIFAADILKVGAVGYGWLSAAQSIGATTAAVIISQLEGLRRQGPVLLGAVVLFGLATIGFGVSTSFVASMLALMVIGGSDSVSAIIRNTIRQVRTPDNLRGRMVSINQLFFVGGPQLGEIEAGAVAQLLGAPFAVVSGGVACILSVLWIARRWPQLRQYSHETGD
ncbi:MAG TPA: MFS transporter [Anaerolineales bacterium]|nr:MFS transporter [Anaerolineales bacterium]